MKVGIILLSQNDMYVDSEGNLPTRPDFDKELLVALCKGQKFTCGTNTIWTLPPSIMDNAYYDRNYDINLGIITLVQDPPHLLLVSRSDDYMIDGKSFSLKSYKRYFESEYFELWIRIS